MADRQTSSQKSDSLTGKLLIAMPNLSSGCFQKSVILLCRHTETEAMGVIINKQIEDLVFGEVLTQLEIEPTHKTDQTPVYYGGPVATKRGIVLHSSDYDSPETTVLLPELALTATKGILEHINVTATLPGAYPKHSLLCMGHAGWGPGQLEAEIAQNAWLHTDADNALIFQSDKDKIWTQSLARLGVMPEMLSPAWTTMRDADAFLN